VNDVRLLARFLAASSRIRIGGLPVRSLNHLVYHENSSGADQDARCFTAGGRRVRKNNAAVAQSRGLVAKRSQFVATLCALGKDGMRCWRIRANGAANAKWQTRAHQREVQFPFGRVPQGFQPNRSLLILSRPARWANASRDV